MPKSQLDWLGVVSLWLGAAIMAIKAASFQIVPGAPDWLSANWWNYIPLALISVFLIIAIYRAREPKEIPVIAGAPKSMAKPDDRVAQHRRILEALENVMFSSGIAMADASPSGKQRTAERELPHLKAALLSVHKLHGTPMPPELTTHTPMQVELHRRLIEVMLPYLKEGHIEEATTEGKALLGRINPSKGEAQ